MGKSIALRKSLQRLQPYRSARLEVQETDDYVFLDANENWQSPVPGMNRYPDPLQDTLRKQLASLRGVAADNILLCNGSDEGIDLLVRSFCEPGKDRILITPPAFAMFSFAAQINAAETVQVPLDDDFQLQLPLMEKQEAKICFLCSPGNPSAVALRKEDIFEFSRSFQGLVVVDEAYVDFCPEKSVLAAISDLPNLVVLQTFSKAWGLAGIRLGAIYSLPYENMERSDEKSFIP